jgi:hypothetical protein
LLFPHACPHEGGKVISTPKLLLRGEVMIQWEKIIDLNVCANILQQTMYI